MWTKPIHKNNPAKPSVHDFHTAAYSVLRYSSHVFQSRVDHGFNGMNIKPFLSGKCVSLYAL